MPILITNQAKIVMTSVILEEEIIQKDRDRWNNPSIRKTASEKALKE